MEGAFPAGPNWAQRLGLRLGWSALAAAVFAAGCAHLPNYIGTTAASYLKRVREDPDPNLRYLAYSKLAEPGCYTDSTQKDEAAALLSEKIAQGKEPVASRAVILRTLGELRRPGARDVVLKAVNDSEPVLRVEACRALGKVGNPEDATILTRIMMVDTLEDCRIAAIESLGELKSADPRITRMLVNGMRHEDPATRLASLQSLRKITGKDEGVEAAAWEKMLPKESDDKAFLASQTQATPAKPVRPAYPPRPSTPASFAAADAAGKRLDGRPDDSLPVVHEAPPGQAGANMGGPPPGVGIGSYPSRNPNLPTPPGGL